MSVGTQLWIARHGEAACNAAGIVGGPTGCTGLSPRGHRQVAQLADRLAREHPADPFAVVITTPRLRALQTAAAISASTGLAARVVEDLRGPDHGDADGRPWHEVKTAFAGPPQHRPDEPYAAGSETWNQYLARAITALDQLLADHAGQRILIAAHGETVEAAHTRLLHLTADTRAGLAFAVGHASLTIWEQHTNRFNRRTWVMAAHNDTSHLREPG